MSPEACQEHVCAACSGCATFRCSRCRMVRYCSKECQRKHWPAHKKKCNAKDEKKHEELQRAPVKDEGPCSHCSKKTSLKCSNCRNVFFCSKQCQQNSRTLHKRVCFPSKAKTTSGSGSLLDADGPNSATSRTPLFKAGENDMVGRFMTAARDLRAGEIILGEDPLVLCPMEPKTFMCLGCYRAISDTYRCSRCDWPMCGPECDKEARHAPECQIISALPKSSRPIAEPDAYKIIFPIRCHALREDSEKFEPLMGFQNHIAERQVNSRKAADEKYILSKLKKFNLKFKPKNNGDTLEKFVQHCLGALDVNAFEIVQNGTEILGLYPFAALFEHSCTPNTKHHFSPSHQIIFKAAVDIKEGDHIKTSYTRISWGTFERRNDLLDNKYFLCCCPRCMDPTEMGSYFSALKCSNCKDGYLLQEDCAKLESNWKCNSCTGIVPHIDAVERTKLLGKKVEEVMAKPQVENLESLFNESVAIAHYNHFHLFKAHHTLLQLYGRGATAGKEEALTKKEAMCREFINVCNKFDPGESRLGPFTAVAYYEYHDLIMIRTHKLFKKEYRDQKLIDQGIHAAKVMLTKCIKALQDEHPHSPEGQLRLVAQKKLTDISLLATNTP